MKFNFASLDYIYYPISGIMWVWHWVFDKITPDTAGGHGIAWALSVVALVFSLRAILYKPFVKQIQTTKKMQEIQPQMQAIRKKYGKDQVKMAEEMQKLQREHGFNPLLGCLPMFMQIPVFIGLFHVLRSFNRTKGMSFSPRVETMGVLDNAQTGNYFFSAHQVQEFLEARLFGVPIGSFITMKPDTDQWRAFIDLPVNGHLEAIGSPFTKVAIIAAIVPIMLIASFMTHMNARASVNRQAPEAAEQAQTRIMNRLSMWIFPLGILVSGVFFPLAILLYWVSNNIWTYGQQHLVFNRIEKEEKAAAEAKEAANKELAPKPGAKPGRTKREEAAAEAEAAEADAKLSKPAPGQKPATAKKKSAQGSAAAKGKQAGSRQNRKAAQKSKKKKR
ncbi:MAG: membrane protein insertase YidC [Gordonia sp. (in: high G+C Gram-positive bacteria)]|uniref:membrane protein insertase YidC n=1 Tax=Gordonia sp. (in: high G+C Gram-positive bacteria) TaxID=84139 RepID=UPI0039E27F9D